MKPDDLKICQHHVGGRAGTGAFDLPKEFRSDFFLVFYDADAACIPAAQARLASDGYQGEILPYCVTDRDGEGPFHIYRDLFASSVFVSNPEFHRYFYEGQGHDFVNGEAFSIDRTVTVPFVRIDTVCGNEHNQVPAPDILTLDAQGAAYEVLVGATDTLQRNILYVEAEIEFISLYQGQKLFGNVCDLLDRAGFQFFGFRHFLKFGADRQPIGCRSMAVDAIATAQFLKKPARVEREAHLAKLAFIALVSGQIEFGLACLRKWDAANADRAIRWQAFLADVAKAVTSMPAAYRPGVDNFFHQTANSNASGSGLFHRWIRPMIDSHPRLARSYPLLRRGIGAFLGEIRIALSSDTPLEGIFYEYGLREPAERLKRVRFGR